MEAASELIVDQLAADPTLLIYPTLGLNLVFNFILTLGLSVLDFLNLIMYVLSLISNNA